MPPNFRSFDGPPVATEFMGTSISTNGDPASPCASGSRTIPTTRTSLFRNNNRGYVRCTLTPESWTSEFRAVSSVVQPQGTCSTLATFAVEHGRPGAVLAST